MSRTRPGPGREEEPSDGPSWADRKSDPADGQPNQDRPAAIVSEYRSRREPPALLCCEPRWGPWPSGWKWAHADSCRATVEGPRGTYRLRGQKVEVPRDEVWLDLPGVGIAAWLKHPPGHQCRHCLYTEAHLDDDDDDGRPLPAVLEREGDGYDRRAD